MKRCLAWADFVTIDWMIADEWQIECEKSMSNIIGRYLLVKVLPVKMIEIETGMKLG